MSPQISSRDILFLFFLATSDVLAHMDEILRMQEELFASNPDHRHEDPFIINVNPSVCYPSLFSISTHNDQPKHRLYTWARNFTHPSPTILIPRDLPSSFPSTTVDIHIIIPYGEEHVIIPSQQIIYLYGNSSQINTMKAWMDAKKASMSMNKA